MASAFEVLALAKLSFYDNKPTATLYENAVFSVPNNPSPYTPVTWQVASEDNWGGHSGVTNPSRYTVQVAGTYRVSGVVTFSSNATGTRAADLQKNGVRFPSNSSGASFVQAVAGFLSVQVPATNIVCAVGDYIEMGAFQNSGGALNTVAGASYMSVEFLHF